MEAGLTIEPPVQMQKEHALMKGDVWSVVFRCSFNKLCIGAMQSMKCHGGEALRFLSAEYMMKCKVYDEMR